MARKPKRQIPWIPVFACLLIANISAGLLFSSITAVRRVRIAGDAKGIEPALRNELRTLTGKPALLINPFEVESRIQQIPSVRQATFNRNVFSAARLAIVRRQPVASIEGKPGWFLDGQGVLFQSPGTEVQKLSIRLPEEAWHPAVSYSGTWPSGSVAKVCAKLKNVNGLVPGRLEIEASGSVSFWSGTGMRLVLGSPEDLEAKFTKLHELLDANPRLFEQVSRVDLTVPKRPMLVPKSERLR